MTHQLEELIARRVEIAKKQTTSKDPVVQIAWLAQGIDLYHRSNGKMGHSPEKAMEYIISSVTRLIAQHDTELFNEVEEKLLSYRGAYIAAGGKRVDDMVHHSVIKEVIEQYQHKEDHPSDAETGYCNECSDYQWRTNCDHMEYQHKPKEGNDGVHRSQKFTD